VIIGQGASLFPSPSGSGGLSFVHGHPVRPAAGAGRSPSAGRCIGASVAHDALTAPASPLAVRASHWRFAGKCCGLRCVFRRDPGTDSGGSGR
jgi:hypothetical protein